MFISKKRRKELEKRIADLEVQVQSQQEIIIKHINNHEVESKELKNILEETKRTIILSMNYQCKQNQK